MELRSLELKNFGPFKKYRIDFPEEDGIAVLFTGRNNEGKSNIIGALRLVDAATRVVGQTKQAILLNGDEYYALLQQDVQDLRINRTIHNYKEVTAEIRATFGTGVEVIVHLDPVENIAYAEYRGKNVEGLSEVFGFLPALGPLSEAENVLTLKHIRASIDSTLAPRHLRNHMTKLLSSTEYELVRRIVNESWPDIELLDVVEDWQENQINCFYKEDRFEREISWAGQGLQIWFQIITHLVRLRKKFVLVLDEPEVNLHPGMQNELLRILSEQFNGTILIATHSVEMMNNVNIDHIVHVKKGQPGPLIKKPSDRRFLERIRSNVGSSFNFIASQFEEVERVIYTEDTDDFRVFTQLGQRIDYPVDFPNIAVHGFKEYGKAVFYKQAYDELIGDRAQHIVVLDRDYYPADYLTKIGAELKSHGLKLVLTPGKEMENILCGISPLLALLPKRLHDAFQADYAEKLEDLYTEARSNLFTTHKKSSLSKLDDKTIFTDAIPEFETAWVDKKKRPDLVPGKLFFPWIKTWVHEQTGESLQMSILFDHIALSASPTLRKFLRAIFGTKTLL